MPAVFPEMLMLFCEVKYHTWLLSGLGKGLNLSQSGFIHIQQNS